MSGSKGDGKRGSTDIENNQLKGGDDVNVDLRFEVEELSRKVLIYEVLRLTNESAKKTIL